MFTAKIIVKLKKDVSDPQGIAIKTALEHLDFKGVSGISVGKYFEVDVEASNAEQAHAIVKKMSYDLLSNPVIEDYKYTLEEIK